ncbi:MAG: PCRF domain-containing protein, partial [Gammaproteobacteria bacterium]|nr:PCRF domain-containing protein [Gammaproteobacteria bacterium]
MQAGLLARLERMTGRCRELSRELSSPELSGDSVRYARLSQEYAQLAPLAETYSAWQRLGREIDELTAMQRDAELREMAEADLRSSRQRRQALEDELRALLVPRDPLDSAGVFL